MRRFFIWFDVAEIRVDLPPSDSIYFQVGWFINKKLDVHQFMTVRSCYLAQSGCGLRTFKPILQVFFFFFLNIYVSVYIYCVFENFDIPII